MKKLMMLAAMLAVTMIAVAPALAQDDPQVVADAVNKTATAGGPSGANADANCDDEIIESKAGGVVAKAPCEPAPAPKPAPAPAPKPAPPAPAPKPAPAPAPAPAPKPAPAPAPAPPKPAPAPTPKAAPAPAPAPPAPAPKAAPAPAPAPPKAELPKSGGPSSASLLALGAGTLLVTGGLVARRIVK